MPTRRFRCKECKYAVKVRFGMENRELPWLLLDKTVITASGVYD